MADRDFDPRDGGYIRIMNQFIDKLISYRLDTNEWSILMFIIRMTWGIQGRPDVALGWKTLREKTQLPESSLIFALRKLKARNIIHTIKTNTQTTRYKINSKLSTWKDPAEFTPIHRCKLLHQPTDVTTPMDRCNLPQPMGVTPIKDNIKNTVSKDKSPPPKKKNAENHIPSGSELKIENPWIDEAAWDDFVSHREKPQTPINPTGNFKIR